MSDPHCMIYGIGIDICAVHRIQVGLARHGERLARKLLADSGLLTWRAARRAQTMVRGPGLAGTA